ncbi:MAG: 16S rRNA (guanine(527)-N(7))-methyltransferase RsmG [Bacteroidales bacterium]|nr:16S rRNA (guanine(527)-N(7))-methyltransferase RsmG [Bacteroidales bacterium]
MRTQRSDFDAAAALYREWNERINVVSRKDIDNLYEHHFLHSLAIARYVELHYGEGVMDGASVLDLGTGGGFPGIPLALEWPKADFTLCDSIGKKLKVAQAVADGLGLKNVECVNARAEALPGQFDWIVTRAVASLSDLYPWVKGKYRRSILCLKGGDVLSEISELCRRRGVQAGFVRVWKIEDWINNEYFKEKFVIEVGKSYLCPPKFE